VGGLATDRRLPGEPKALDASPLFQIYAALAPAYQAETLRLRFLAGISWKDAKEALADQLLRELAEPRRRFAGLMAEPGRLDRILADGAARLLS